MRMSTMTVQQDMNSGNNILTARKRHTYALQTAYLRGANSILARSILLLLLLLAGGVTNGAWAATYKYRLLNADNKLVAYCENSAFGIPNNMKSPLVSEYTYYKTGTDADNDGVYDVSDPITSITGINDGDYIYVTYTLTEAGKDMFSGGKFKIYNDASTKDYLAYATGGDNCALGIWGTQGSDGRNTFTLSGDPYSLQIHAASADADISGKDLLMSSPANTGNIYMSTTYTYNTYMAVTDKDGNWSESEGLPKIILRLNEPEGSYNAEIYSIVDNNGKNKAYWRETGTGGMTVKDYSSKWFRFEKQEVKCTYKVISREYGHLAVTTLPTVVGTTLALPDKYCSPMLTTDDYHYWAEGDVTKSTATYEGTSPSKNYDKYTVNDGATELTKVPDEDAVIYVTYDWDTSWASQAGLTHGGAYNIKHGDYVMYQDTWNGEANGKFSNSIDTDNITTIWQFDLTDPYAILVKAVNKGENGYLTYGGNYGDSREYALATAQKKDFWSYILVNGTTGTYRLMVGNNKFTDTSKSNSNAGYLRRDGTNPRFHYNDDPENQSNLTFTRQSIASYKVISRTYGHIAVTTSYFVFHGTPQIPAKYQSPMLLTSDYHYWAEDNVANSADTYSVKDATKELTTLPAGNYDLYVTYEWDSSWASRAGLTHLGLFNVSQSDQYLYQAELYDKNCYFLPLGQNNNVSDKNWNPYVAKTDARALWELDLTDPYAVLVKSTSLGDNGYLSMSGKGAYGNVRELDLTTAKTKGLWSFILTRGISDGSLSLMLGNNCYDNPNDATKGAYLWNDGTATRYNYDGKIESENRRSLVFTQPTDTYTYNIVDNNGRIAIKYTTNQMPLTVLGSDYTAIPAPIRSEYLEGETVTFYATQEDAINGTNAITETPNIDGANIFVRYTTTHLIEKPLHLRGARGFSRRGGKRR